MRDYKKHFIDFALRQEALRFGKFELKSGRLSPYFFNTGFFNSGAALARLADFYASAIVASEIDFDLIFGPAYKGIPLGAAISIAFSNKYNRDIPYAFNRKEVKDHGEGGQTFGAALKGRVLIVDDVISAGTSVGESLVIIENEDAVAAGVMVSLDRQERGSGKVSAINDVVQRYRIPVYSIVTLDDVLQFLVESGDWKNEIAAIKDYRSQYGT